METKFSNSPQLFNICKNLMEFEKLRSLWFFHSTDLTSNSIIITTRPPRLPFTFIHVHKSIVNALVASIYKLASLSLDLLVLEYGQNRKRSRELKYTPTTNFLKLIIKQILELGFNEIAITHYFDINRTACALDNKNDYRNIHHTLLSYAEVTCGTAFPYAGMLRSRLTLNPL
ncbi:hypothetical protein Bhyg_14538 [Pseudolycoriella hygida]|uniref:Uncharacterized protein n=1 Tax=Pseudolycoriella hygida TaxID=35572 RepID=A0A9Q0RXB1_9DIPT|nr:hypothetical protein Bhyg_14538 [Pseudolycoriella hygida]